MYLAQCMLLAVYVGFVQSFSWDIVVARSNRLEFYYEGILVHLATPASHRINWISYDPVHERVLFSEKYNRDYSASSFDIANQTTQSLIKKKADRYLKSFAYDPATELLFGTVTKSIYSFPLRPGNNEVKGDLVITLETIPREVAVDSCGGYVYWTTNNIIERALFNGSDREVIIENNVTLRQGLTIDTQKVYWIESQEFSDGGFSIESADLNGNNRRTLYSDIESDSTPEKLTVSKDFISWGDSIESFFWQLPTHPLNETVIKPNKIAMNTTIFACLSHDIAGHYTIEERTQRVPKCNALLSLLPGYQACLKASEFCVHGTKVTGEFRCDCKQGYIGERCDVSICENYCLQGHCSVSAEGQPTCRCNAGYSGTRCEVYACYKHCLNNGVCSLNEEDDAVCECTGQYEGKRCDVLTTLKADTTSDVDDRTRTAINQTMETTTAFYTGVENYETLTTTTDMPTTSSTPYERFYWLPMVGGRLPPNAIVGGFEDGNEYIARANQSGSLCPGKYVESSGIASVCFKREEYIKEQFEILCGLNATWVKTQAEHLPKNAFVAGTEVNGEPLYICRHKIDDRLICGKAAHGYNKKCWLPYNGEEKEVTTSYEILVEE